MKHSESIAAIAEALAAAQAEYAPVPKNKTAKIKGKNNTEYTYKYADLADVLSMAVPILAAHGIAFLQPNERINGKLFVTTLLAHKSGEWMQSDGIEVDEVEMKWNEFEKKSILERCDPRTIGGDFTYYRRYDGCSFIGIAPDEDIDGANHGPLPEKRGKNTTTATASVMPPQPEPSKAQQPRPAAKDVEGSLQGDGSQPTVRFIPPNGLTCVVKSVIDIPAQGKTRPHVVVTFLGSHNGVSIAYCFDTKFWTLLKESTGVECHFQIAEKDNDKGQHFINITDVIYVAGEEYVDGKPVNGGQQ